MKKLRILTYILTLLGCACWIGMVIGLITLDLEIITIFGVIALTFFVSSIVLNTILNYQYQKSIDLIGLRAVLELEGFEW